MHGTPATRSLYSALILGLLLVTATAAAAPDPFGAWRWAETRLSAEESETPESLGYTRGLFFSEDSALIEYRDETVLRTGTYNYYDYEWDMGMGGIEYFTILETTFPDFDESYSYSIEDEGSTLHMCSGVHPTTGFPWYPCERFVRDESVGNEALSWGALKSNYR